MELKAIVEGVLLYVSILAFAYALFITLGKTTYAVDEIAFRVMLVIISIELFVMWAFATGQIEKMPHVMRANSPITFLLAPSFFVYVYSKLEDVKRFRFLDFLHLAPAFFIFLYLVPFYSLSLQEKLEMYFQWKNGMRVDTIPIEAIYRIQQLVYVMGIAIILLKRWERVSPMVFLIAGAYAAIWGIHIIHYFTDDSGSIYLWIHFISFLPLLIFFELRFRQSGKKYATSGIKKSKAEPIALQTYDLIREEELYKNPKLNLADLAMKLDVHHNYVSQAINSHFGMGFKELINSLRVAEAKSLLIDKTNDRLTFEAIAEMAGFNSVSSFNGSFKKIVGLTPSQFKRKHT